VTRTAFRAAAPGKQELALRTHLSRHDDGNPAREEILLVFEVRVGCHEDSETFFLGSIQQLAVLQGGPATLMGGDYLMLRQEPPQWDRSALVKQYAHSGNSQGAPGRVFEHGANLLDSDAGKPLNELRDERAVFKVLEERRHRHPGAAKYPGTTYALGIAFNSRTGRPIDHALHITTRPEKTANGQVTGLSLAAGPSERRERC
jgi:hypothetical protein